MNPARLTAPVAVLLFWPSPAPKTLMYAAFEFNVPLSQALTAIGPNRPPEMPKSDVKLAYVLKTRGIYAGPDAAVPTMPAGTPVVTRVGTLDLSVAVIDTPGYGKAGIMLTSHNVFIRQIRRLR